MLFQSNIYTSLESLFCHLLDRLIIDQARLY
uniref:Uncharacterized protein n=1 Tax=Anguilla anguilla TaxID=7936 RepID=A0A0E9U1A0_ANGAN